MVSLSLAVSATIPILVSSQIQLDSHVFCCFFFLFVVVVVVFLLLLFFLFFVLSMIEFAPNVILCFLQHLNLG